MKTLVIRLSKRVDDTFNSIFWSSTWPLKAIPAAVSRSFCSLSTVLEVINQLLMPCSLFLRSMFCVELLYPGDPVPPVGRFSLHNVFFLNRVFTLYIIYWNSHKIVISINIYALNTLFEEYSLNSYIILMSASAIKKYLNLTPCLL